MKKTVLHFLIVTAAALFSLLSLSASAQEQQQQKTIIQTPFGPKEIDVPATPAPATPQLQTAPAATQPAPPAPAAAQPAPQPQQPLPGQQPPAPAPAGQGDDIATISLHLDNTDIYQVIKIICDYMGLNYIIDPAVRGTVNINTSWTLRRSDLLPILETILKIN